MRKKDMGRGEALGEVLKRESGGNIKKNKKTDNKKRRQIKQYVNSREVNNILIMQKQSKDNRYRDDTRGKEIATRTENKNEEK